VVLATVAMGTAAHGGLSLGRHLVGLFLLGPVLGALVGWVGITMLTNIRDRIGVRRDYESLYALGIGFAAYAAAEAVGGSGFLAAFAAGFAIATLDVELCDCFLEYGEATAEMLLLLTFVALGTSLIWTGFGILDVATIAFAGIALSMRTLVLYPVLAQMGVERRERKLISLFGPRGLSSLLLVLIPVFAGVPGSDRLFTITSLVVVLSLAIHGGIIGYYLRRRSRPAPPARAPRAALPTLESPVDERITIAEVEAMRARGDEVVLVDARAAKSYNADPRQAAGAVRLPPDDPVRAAQEVRLSQRGTVVVYCA
jgi:NhaP-type Na+/H+ or K+/H+ antiporter